MHIRFKKKYSGTSLVSSPHHYGHPCSVPTNFPSSAKNVSLIADTVTSPLSSLLLSSPSDCNIVRFQSSKFCRILHIYFWESQHCRHCHIGIFPPLVLLSILLYAMNLGNSSLSPCSHERIPIGHNYSCN